MRKGERCHGRKEREAKLAPAERKYGPIAYQGRGGLCHFPQKEEVAHCAAFRAGFVVWHLSPHRIARRPYKQQNETRARANHIMGEKSITAEFLHNRPPVGSRILRLAIGDLARDAKQRETLQI